MTDPGLGDNLKGLSGSLDKVLQTFTKIDGVAARLDKRLKGMGRSLAAVSGNGNTGSTGGFTIGGSDATFNGAIDAMSGMAEKMGKGTFGKVAGGMIRAAGDVASMMPDVNATMTRMAQGYNVAVMNGMGAGNNEFRAGMQRSTLAMMQNGLTGPGSDMQFANIMAGSGIAFNANYNSTYMQNAREVSGLAKYLNIDNATAAQSMANLTSGATSSMLMRNLGIMTSDPMSGKMYSFKDIASQFENRITRGGKLTAEGIMDSYHRGFLGVSLANSGFDETQQQMIIQDLMSKAKTGKGIDWANTEEMDKLAADNPMLSQYKMNYSDTRQMQKAEGAYKTGVDTAVGGLTQLNEIAGDLAATFGSLKSGIETFTGHRAGAGILNLGSDIMNTIRDIIPFGGSSSSIGIAYSSVNSRSGSVGAFGTGDSNNTVGPDPVSSGSTGSGGSSGGNTSTNSQPNQGPSKVFKVCRPVSGGRVTLGFGVVDARHKEGHHGMDFGVAEGTSVVAGHDGKVLKIESGGALGNYLRISWSENDKYGTGYAHLKSINVSKGDVVTQGQVVALSGNTGTNTTGAHLHFEVWQNGQRVDPAPFISGGVAVDSSGRAGVPTNDTSNMNSTGVDEGSGIPLPVSLTSQSQIMVDKGSVSSTGSTDYYQTGSGGDTNKLGIDASTAPKYSSNKPVKDYLSVAGSSGQTHSLVSGSGGHSSSKPNVVINLTIGKATDTEARKFAEKVRDYLQEDRLISNMGRA